MEDRKILLESSSQLLEMFRFPWEMMPIMYALSKYANGNTQEVLMKIYEGKNNHYIDLEAKSYFYRSNQELESSNYFPKPKVSDS